MLYCKNKIDMKIIIFIQILFFAVVSLQAKTINTEDSPYYYYKGEKQLLIPNENVKYFVFNNKSDLDNLNQLNSNYFILSFGENLASQKLNLINPNVPTNYWALIGSTSGKWDSPLLTHKNIGNYNAFKDVNEEVVGMSNMFYVKLNIQSDLSILNEFTEERGLFILGQNKFMPKWFTVICPVETGKNPLDMANELYESNMFAATEPNFLSQNMTNCVTDPEFNSQWGHNNIFSCAGWSITMGVPDITIAIVDHGIDNGHEDLDDNTLNLFFDTPSGNSNYQIYGDHGTHVAGIAAAEENSDFGIGLAPYCKLMSISDPLHSGYGTTAQTLADGINFAWSNGADVINCSWHWPEQSSFIDDAITKALLYGRNGLGSVLVFASGNDGVNYTGDPVSYPANSNSDIIVVGASNQNNYRSGFSNYGSQLDVLAPGFEVLSTLPGNDSGYKSGTSMAAPKVAGLAALILSLNPCLTVNEVEQIICESAQKVTVSYPINYPYGDWDKKYGYGLINVEAALSSVLNTYYQDKTETIAVLHNHVGDIRAGDNVTNNISNGPYIVDAGAAVEFKATSTISLEAGFEVRAEAQFLAQVKLQTENCGDWNTIFLKRGNTGEGNDLEAKDELADEVFSAVSNISLYPNPFRDNFSVEFELVHDEIINIQVFNLLGHLVYSEEILGKKGRNKSIIEMEPGSNIFVVKLQGSTSHFSTILLKE
jgi:subtilisin family serine protease